jgi:benzaldehyde dehydrogenase (NAD)
MTIKLATGDYFWEGKIFSGGWIETASQIEVIEPATGEVLTRSGQALPADVSRAAKSAASRQPEWAKLPSREKAKIFRRAAAIIERDAEFMAHFIARETGGILPKGEVEVRETVEILHYAAGLVSQPQGQVLPSRPNRMSLARRVPLGVVGVISPFNFPLILSSRYAVPALATGNAVVLKPDPQTPVTGGFFLARALEEAGLPAGVLHVLPGGSEVGEALCSDPDIAMVAFTGSPATGRKVGELCGRHLKKVQLELWGKNALILLDDADLDLAVSNAAWGAYLHQGQICMATGRILVHERIVKRFTEKLKIKAETLQVGDPMKTHVVIGPLINQRHLDRVHAIVQETVKAGARLETGGTFQYLFYRPTVLGGVQPGMRAFNEEIFGPVACITPFSTDEEVVSLANDNQYGLAAAVISKSVSRALSIGNQLRVGLLHINDQTVNDEVINPFDGFGASGNGASVGGTVNLDQFTQWQWLTIKDSPPQYPF